MLIDMCPWPHAQGVADLFKLAVIEVACSHFYFTATQALEVSAQSLLHLANHRLGGRVRHILDLSLNLQHLHSTCAIAGPL